MKDSISNTFYNPKKSLSTNKRKISLVKNKNSIEINKTNSNLFTSYVKNTKKKKSSINYLLCILIRQISIKLKNHFRILFPISIIKPQKIK